MRRVDMGALEKGSMKGDVKEKILLLLLEGFVFLGIQPLSMISTPLQARVWPVFFHGLVREAMVMGS